MAAAARTSAARRRNEAARQYAGLHPGLVADFAALHYWGNQIQVTRSRPLSDALVPLFAMLEGCREDAANDWRELAESLGERLPERHFRSSYRGIVSEFGGERPDDPCDPEDASTICDQLGRLPVPGVKGLAILTRIVDVIPGVVVPNTRLDRTLPTRIAMVPGRAAEADACRTGGPAVHSGYVCRRSRRPRAGVAWIRGQG